MKIDDQSKTLLRTLTYRFSRHQCINDCVLGFGLEEFEMNFVEMVQCIRSWPDSEILLLSSQLLETPPYDRLVLDYYETVEKVAEEMDVGFVDVYGAWMEDRKSVV